MDKTLAGLLGALGAVAAAAPAVAHPDATLAAGSYRELLAPIPNAAATLRALDAQAAPEGNVEVAQIAIYAGPRGHHHHHNRYYRRPVRHHHHHHHHHNNYER